MIGVFALGFGGFAPEKILTVLGTWLTGDFVGAIVFVPIFSSFYKLYNFPFRKERIPELILAGLIHIVIISVVFLGWPIQFSERYPILYLTIPILLWIAFRFCVRATSIALLVTSFFAVVGTLFNQSIFNTGSLNTALINLQLFIFVISLIILPITVLLNDSKHKR